MSGALPYFFIDDIAPVNQLQILPEETSKHVVQVLRMKVQESLRLADGKGKLATAVITDDHKRKCTVTIVEIEENPLPSTRHTIAISLLKNSTRFEWFLEKAAELGIGTIVPLLCARTEKQHFRYERMKSILVSAMLQSQQSWITELSEPVPFDKFLTSVNGSKAFIAHCEEGEKKSLFELHDADSKLVLIGPEGDFSPAEIEAAIAAGCQPVTLGNTRLRTETAGVVAATLL